MKILFVRQNMPGQYRHLAPALAAMPDNEVVFVTQRRGNSLPGVATHAYRPHRAPGEKQHRYLRDTEARVLNGQAVATRALGLKRSGFVPDVMLGHNAWGETWYLKDVFPNTPLVGYFEFFYRATGADVDFDPAQPLTVDDRPRLRTKNLGNLLGLQAADWGQCPTAWQCSTYPELYRPKLKVIHDGIDTDVARPDAQARLELPGTDLTIQAGDEVVTYVARNLEPYRGFPSFMRSLPRVLAQRPRARVLIVGATKPVTAIARQMARASEPSYSTSLATVSTARGCMSILLTRSCCPSRCWRRWRRVAWWSVRARRRSKR